ncbi:cytidylate kinase-like family protein [Cuneatibacter sp. NSJ-177]|uniref:cytidylate kinase-like family protein n=1 Tax=Cuneatibacter sp. NSJ-177 TaxID=2931401 RepID=UPI001FD0C0FF|nr:cytidylate kinase-like family protein [Cuneatibacter sp. NSJ-177]MCJ7834695.1 cytidylate kinase-like family protein [Cuneatibacter sp. NSJ-177]
MKNRIITISREFGSGGRTVGKQTAEKLGIPCYDQEILEKLSEESEFVKDYVKEQSEYANYGGFWANAFSSRSLSGISNQDYLWIIQKQLILDLAGKGSCVIVGRCADFILKDTTDCLTVFIHAQPQKRMERVVKIYGETDVPTEKRLMDKDKRRAAYYQFYTDMQWGQAQNYHIALDSGILGIETCVGLLTQLYQHGLPDGR